MDKYQRIIDILKTCKRVLVTTHVRPDGDALGSSAAIVLGMRKLGIESEVLLLSHLPSKYAFLFNDFSVPFFDVEKSWPADFDLNRYDALLVVDTGTWSQLPGLKERIEPWPKPKLVVDHHLTQENWADAKLVVTEAAAACEIVAELLQQWGIAIDSSIATALYIGIASDTGWFQFSNTRPFTMRLAATLMEAGVNTDQLYQHLYQNERSQRVLLQTRAMQSLELLAGGKLAVMTVRKEDFTQTGAHVPDTENLINIPLQIRTVEVSLLFVEPPDAGPIRVSLRSKGGVDVARFAEQFGGGGHARAAGLKLDPPLEIAKKRVLEKAMAINLSDTSS
ncbi:MAG TPA: bifunctional oligoribonuclease/PAP phosphatase NrnA [Tepidisphaeraceae bacterium]|jgi:phosphoesterase RecJ-like protein|nr:bifunctional oligoribonuclease/PAP phosphatase NrnA [Tepidisphaeraceae bacterium]